MAFVLALIVSVYLIIAIVVCGYLKPGYDHVRHTISELGEIGSEYSRIVSYGVFLPVGLLLILVAGLSAPIDSSRAALAISISIGYLSAAFFPCDPGSPILGNFRQGLHNLGGAVEYLGGAAALMWISESFGAPFEFAGATVAISVLILSFESPIRGIVQRVAELVLFAGLCVALWTN